MKLKKLLINTSICFVLLSMLSVPLMSYYAAEVTTQDTTDYTVSKSTLENYKAGWIPDEYDRIGVTSDDSIFGLPVKYDPIKIIILMMMFIFVMYLIFQPTQIHTIK